MDSMVAAVGMLSSCKDAWARQPLHLGLVGCTGECPGSGWHLVVLGSTLGQRCLVLVPGSAGRRRGSGALPSAVQCWRR